jgi:hypothetical protein
MKLLGGAWTPNVIWYLSGGPRRFGELRTDIPRVSAKVLTERLRSLEAKGVKVYVEPRPNVNAPRWFRYPVISVDTFWERSDPALYADSSWGARNEQLTGEILRLITAPPEGKTWGHKGGIAPYVQGILRDGHTAVAAPVGLLIGEQIPLHELLRKDGPRPSSAPAQATLPPPLDRNATMQLQNTTAAAAGTITNLPYDANGNLIPSLSQPKNAGFGVATAYQIPRSVQAQIRFQF